MGFKHKLIFLLAAPLLLPVYFVLTLIGWCCPTTFTRWFIFNVPGASWQQGDITAEQWQKAHATAPEVDMPAIGSLVELDFRESIQCRGEGEVLRVLSWNIFLGQNLQGIIDELLGMIPRPDVILLQEDNLFLDATVAAGRTSVFRLAGGAVARAMKMKYVFTPAYYRGHPPQLRGCYGMSILSSFELSNVKTFPCPVQPKIVAAMLPFLHGERHFPYAEISLPDSALVAVVSVHLPSMGRFRERAEMLRVLLAQLRAQQATTRERGREGEGESGKRPLALIGGDFNTLPFVMRYIVPFGSNDLCLSSSSEPSLFRPLLAEMGFDDPFLDTDGTFPKLETTKMDWLLFQPQDFEAVETRVQSVLQGQRLVTDTGSDHLWISAHLKRRA